MRSLRSGEDVLIASEKYEKNNWQTERIWSYKRINDEITTSLSEG
jgi:hypothetical protein